MASIEQVGQTSITRALKSRSSAVALPPEDPKSLSCRSFKTALCRALDLSLPSTYRAAESHELELLHRNSRTNLILKLEGCRPARAPFIRPLRFGRMVFDWPPSGLPTTRNCHVNARYCQ